MWDTSSATLLLTPEQTRELIGKMHALIDTCRDRAAEAGDAGTARVRVHTHAFPIATD
ncbi:hypothetical protein J2X68_005236 [Streptomyces sp. 3330]|uniref:hypothetical protein n=1 Tax=Streptomyces sp. 3330 TaxID=2817755 RepID=UPI0028588F43|nr:hypothetical protein [Streptomyces sp. 3330]MDR6978510.1 hypothetical protein [Streptomyces sp. 3330]